MVEYGRNLGTAFQLVDDYLDYEASADELGKNLGDDLAEGKPTLPLIYAMAHGDDQQRKAGSRCRRNRRYQQTQRHSYRH